jgi:leucyl-tRNA synthetase
MEVTTKVIVWRILSIVFCTLMARLWFGDWHVTAFGIFILSNHLTFFIMHHIAIFNEKDWPRGISLNEMLIREGAKMSKSKGNVLPLVDISGKYTADLFRLYLTSAADLESTLDWKENEVLSVKKKLEDFRSIVEESLNAEPDTNNWLYNMFNYMLSRAEKFYESMKFRDAVIELFFNVMNDIKRYKKHSDYKSAVAGILDDWLIALSPVIPHTAEEYWHRRHGNERGFVVNQKWPEAKEIDESFLSEMKLVDSAISDIKKILSVSKENYNKAYIYTAEDWMYDVVSKLASGAKMPEILKDYEDKGKVAAFVKRAMKEGIAKEFVGLNEAEILEKNKNVISAEVGLEVEINSEYDPANKKSRAIPLRPAIYLE